MQQPNLKELDTALLSDPSSEFKAEFLKELKKFYFQAVKHLPNSETEPVAVIEKPRMATIAAQVLTTLFSEKEVPFSHYQLNTGPTRDQDKPLMDDSLADGHNTFILPFIFMVSHGETDREILENLLQNPLAEIYVLAPFISKHALALIFELNMKFKSRIVVEFLDEVEGKATEPNPDDGDRENIYPGIPQFGRVFDGFPVSEPVS